MPSLDDYQWEKLIRVSTEEVKKWFVLVAEERIKENFFIRFYSLPVIDNKIDEEGLFHFLLSTVEGYVFDENEVSEQKEDGENPYINALKYFGDVDPIRDGKYGELILYILTEGVLNVPLIVHKISNSYNPNKQIEGSDGLFLGRYLGKVSLLIGESKMRNVFSVCLPDAIHSIERFQDKSEPLSHEIKVARKHLSRDIQNLDHAALDNLYNALKLKSEAFNELQFGHPVLLVYKESDFKKLKTDVHAEVNRIISSKRQSRVKSIAEQTSHFSDKICFDFFLIPVNDVSHFRKELYKAFHGGEEYVEKTDKED